MGPQDWYRCDDIESAAGPDCVHVDRHVEVRQTSLKSGGDFVILRMKRLQDKYNNIKRTKQGRFTCLESECSGPTDFRLPHDKNNRLYTLN